MVQVVRDAPSAAAAVVPCLYDIQWQISEAATLLAQPVTDNAAVLWKVRLDFADLPTVLQEPCYVFDPFLTQTSPIAHLRI